MLLGSLTSRETLHILYVVRLHRGTAHDRAHEEGPTGSVRLKRGERTVPLVIDRKLLQARGCERTAPLTKSQKVLQGRGCERTVPLAKAQKV